MSPGAPARSGARTRIAFLVTITLLATSLAGCPGSSAERLPEAFVEIGTQRVAVDLAITPEEQQLGLGGRDELPWGEGMYFVYERRALYGFWMKGMRFPIDIVWIREGRIVDISPRVPFVPGENGPTVRPREAVDAVLEVPAGYASASGWRIGDRVRLVRNDR